MLAGEVAGAMRGWPITLDHGEFLIVPDDDPQTLEAIERAAATLGVDRQGVDDPYRGLDSRRQWTLPGNQRLVVSVQPAGSHGYRDLVRDSEPLSLGGALVQVGSLRDLIRLADASPRERERAFTPALWATLDQFRAAERAAA